MSSESTDKLCSHPSSKYIAINQLTYEWYNKTTVRLFFMIASEHKKCNSASGYDYNKRDKYSHNLWTPPAIFAPSHGLFWASQIDLFFSQGTGDQIWFTVSTDQNQSQRRGFLFSFRCLRRFEFKLRHLYDETFLCAVHQPNAAFTSYRKKSNF